MATLEIQHEGKRSDTEDRFWWYRYGEEKEIVFVERVCPSLGLEASINPEKKKNKKAPDLIVEGLLADLKCQSLPFFRASDFFRIPPQFAVTFNWIDYDRYFRLYPGIVIYFWVHWTRLQPLANEIKIPVHERGRKYRVSPMCGVWRGDLAMMKASVGGSHEYLRRGKKDARGNAIGSFVVDLRSLECVACRTADQLTFPYVSGDWRDIDDYSELLAM